MHGGCGRREGPTRLPHTTCLDETPSSEQRRQGRREDGVVRDEDSPCLARRNAEGISHQIRLPSRDVSGLPAPGRHRVEPDGDQSRQLQDRVERRGDEASVPPVGEASLRGMSKSGTSWLPTTVRSGPGSPSRNERASQNWCRWARWVRSPETTTRSGRWSQTSDSSGSTSSWRWAPKWMSDKWTMTGTDPRRR